MRRFILSSLLICLPISTLADSKYEAHDNIRDAALQHVLERKDTFAGKLNIEVHRLDRRLKLNRCDIPLETYESPNGIKAGRSVVGVRCDGVKPWKIYVSVSIAIKQQVLVSRHPIARGEELNAGNLKLEIRDTAKLHKAYFTNTKQAAGFRAKRPIQAGKIISSNMLARRQLVRRGSEVQIISRHGSLQVRMKGKALSNGTKGERIRVRNKASGREITGEVISAGVILVQE